MLIFSTSVVCQDIWADVFDLRHSKWTTVLTQYQDAKGLVTYHKLKSDSQKDSAHPFNRYLGEIELVRWADYQKWSKFDQMAFLINAYNALTVKLILQHYPVASIKKIGGFFTKPWKINFFNLLDGKIKNLDAIEHEWLRPKFKDYRIHAAVNCASISCPPLRHESYVGERLNQQLDDQMRSWLKDSPRNNLNLKDRVFTVSKIFDWYKDDFVAWGGGPLAVINRFLEPQLSNSQLDHIKLKYLDYNWDLNDSELDSKFGSKLDSK